MRKETTMTLDPRFDHLPADERCPVCGLPDNCGDCDHTPFTDEEAAEFKMECLEASASCRGKVTMWTTDGLRSWPRCDFHGERRLERFENSIERYANSDVAPDWFDPTIAGERWDEDY